MSLIPYKEMATEFARGRIFSIFQDGVLISVVLATSFSLQARTSVGPCDENYYHFFSHTAVQSNVEI